jgi:hypothetical protein
MITFTVSAVSASTNSIDSAILFGALGARADLDRLRDVALTLPEVNGEPVLDLSRLGETNVTVGDDDQGPITAVSFIEVEGPEGDAFTVARISRQFVTDDLLLRLRDGRLLDFAEAPGASFRARETEVAQTTFVVVEDAPGGTPVAADDAFTTEDGVTLSIGAPGVLANDSDPDGDALQVIANTDPTNGQLNFIREAGNFSYTPNAGFVGVDSFTYTISDGVETDEATVTITVTNAAPTANDDAFTTEDGTTLSIAAPSLLQNDTDPDEGDTLRLISSTEPTNGRLNFIGETGNFSYTPNAGFVGVDSFTYTISDGAATDEATVTITVTNAAPTANDDAFTTEDGTTLSIAAPGLLQNDSDPDGDALQVIANTDPTNGRLNFIREAGNFSYTPNAGFVGVDSFTYTISDGAATDEATVTITVRNDAPQAEPDSYTLRPDTVLVVAAAQGVLANDTDPDGDPLSVAGFEDAANGVVEMAPDGGFTYTPDPGFVGAESLTYQVTDGFNTVEGRYTISVVNARPVANADAFSTPFNTTLSLEASAGVLANDVDGDGDALQVVDFDPSSLGILDIAQDGALTFIPTAGATGVETLGYTVSDGFQTSVGALTITVGDNGAPIATDDAYVVFEDSVLTISPLNGVLSNDSDPDGDPLSAALLSGPSNGMLTLDSNGAFRYSPAPDFNGVDRFTYEVRDGNGGVDQGAVEIDVFSLNDAPVAVDDAAETDFQTPVVIDVLANDTDVDNPAGDLSVTNVFIDTGRFGFVTGNDDGTLTFTPRDDFAGVATFDYEVSDGDREAEGEVTVTVGAPGARTITVSSLNIVEGDEDVATGVVTFTRSGDLRPRDVLVGQTRNGTAVEGQDFGSLFFQRAFEPGQSEVAIAVEVFGDENVEGFEQFFIDFNVDSLFGGVSVEAAAAPGDSPSDFTAPVGIIDDDFAISVDSPSASESAGSITFTITRRGDLPADSFGVELVEGTADSPEDFLGDGLFLPIQFAEGQELATFTVQLVDDRPQEDDETFFLRLFDDVEIVAQGTGTILNDDPPNTGAPVAVDDRFVAPLNRADIRLDALANDSDPDGDAFRIDRVTQPANGTVAVGADGALLFTPASAGTASFTYTLSDGELGSNAATVTVDVVDTGATPFFVTDVTVTEGDAGETTQAVFTVFRNGDASEESETLFVQVVDGSATAPDDYSDGLFLPFTFAPGQIQTTVTILVNGDDVFEDDETFFLELREARDATVLATGRATILNDDDRPNAPPTATDDVVEVGEDDPAAVVVNVLANDSDLEGGVLRVVQAFDATGREIVVGAPSALPEGGVVTIGENGDVTFDPAGDFEALGFNPQPEPPAALARLRYVAADVEGATDDATLTIGVRGVNDGPVARDDGPFAATEGAATGPLDLLANDIDPEGDALAIVGSDAFTALGGRVILAADGQSVSVDYAEVDLADLGEGEARADRFEYTVSDGRAVDAGAVSLLLTGKPDEGGLNAVVGSDASERLIGTDAADLIQSLGGRLDIVAGGDGLDVFDFSNSTANGIRETRQITDYVVGESIDIGAAEIASFRESLDRVFLYLDGDRDVIVVGGVADFEALTII